LGGEHVQGEMSYTLTGTRTDEGTDGWEDAYQDEWHIRTAIQFTQNGKAH